ncbi:fasciclin domain-containing protein [Sphingomonas ginkgonis]|nr:fasciclin domain-containing protein [Sphingomonas ginkgonis]
MRNSVSRSGLAFALAVLAGCHQQPGNNAAANQAGTNQAAKGSEGGSKLSDGLGNDRKFAAAIHQAGLDRTLAGQGPYTVLAPTDAAFDKIPPATKAAMMKPEGRQQLTQLLTFHILPGVILAADIDRAIQNGKGTTKLATMNGETISASKENGSIVLSDRHGGKARLASGDEQHSNGVLHQLDGVLSPG